MNVKPVKGKKEDKIIRELFRQKLENTEVIPGPSVKYELMRKVARREFLRFNPGRFNVWYIGGILAAGLIAALLIVTVDHKKIESISEASPAEAGQTPTVSPKSGSEDLVVKRIEAQTEKISKESFETPEINVLLSPVENPDNITFRNEFQIRNNLTRTEINESLSEKGLFSESGNDNRNNLKNTAKPVEGLIEASAASGCVPLKVHFSSKPVNGNSYLWTFGDGGSSAEKETDWIFDVEGEYRVVLDVITADGTRTTSSIVIIVHPKPVARFEIIPENPIIPDDEIRFINYSTDAVIFMWDFDDGNSSDLFEPRYSYKKSGNYDIRLTVSSIYGCSDSLVVLNAFTGKGYYVNFPNAFIPNPGGPSGGYFSPSSDESAYIFHPEMFGVSDFHLRIFSRRGLLIFESRDINVGWDGYFNGQLSEPGVYIWKVRGTYINGESFTKMGDVTLLKSAR